MSLASNYSINMVPLASNYSILIVSFGFNLKHPIGVTGSNSEYSVVSLVSGQWHKQNASS